MKRYLFSYVKAHLPLAHSWGVDFNHVLSASHFSLLKLIAVLSFIFQILKFGSLKC